MHLHLRTRHSSLVILNCMICGKHEIIFLPCFCKIWLFFPVKFASFTHHAILQSEHFPPYSLLFLLASLVLKPAHAWVFIPFCCLYVIAISGNGMILFAIITESSLFRSPCGSFPLHAILHRPRIMPFPHWSPWWVFSGSTLEKSALMPALAKCSSSMSLTFMESSVLLLQWPLIAILPSVTH